VVPTAGEHSRYQSISLRAALQPVETSPIGLGFATTAVAKPAIAQSTPNLKWRLTASWPKSLDTLYGTAEIFAKAVAEATDNKFQIQTFAAGEIVPGLNAADAVTNGTIEMCHTASYYYVGKDPTYAFGSTVPFGLNSRMQNAWMFFGGGMALMNEFYKKANIYAIPCGNAGARAVGSARRLSNPPISTALNSASPVSQARYCKSSAVCRNRLQLVTSIRR
jgi:TRAP-type mannitol/chloroaromatic compound transport system substrate-binding protein